MASGSGSKPPEKAGGEPGRPRPGPRPPKIEPFVPNTDHNPRELKSWAKRTGFNFSGEAEVSGRSGVDVADAGKRRNGSSPKTEIDPVLGKSKGKSEGEGEIGLAAVNGNVVDGSGKRDGAGGNGVPGGKAAVVVAPLPEAKDPTKSDRDVEIDMFSSEPEPDNLLQTRYSGTRLKYSLQEKPGPVPLLLYGIQHYLSLAGSLIFIPLIIVPAMGGSDEETATVISTMLLVSGVTTILQLYFGTRLPLVQGSSFVYLAPALVIINSEDFRNLSENKFKHIMKELQGAIIVGSVFQTIFGFSGLMSMLLRFINPVVVAPTVAAMGLAFFSYGFPLAGSCVEISIPQIVLLFLFAMYLRGINVYGHRVFQIFAVPLSIVLVWMYAFFLTHGGAYNFKGCSANIPSSNILTDACRRHSFTMKHCRTDASSAWKTASWVRVPYPFQWGIPTFHLRTSIIMLAVSLVASVDSVGSYHSASLLANIPPPTPGIVSRGIGLEGFSSMLAALWGTGTGSTTLVESVHTIDSTKIASRRIIAAGAVCLILFSFFGKIGALLASIPLALAASVLCYIWALIAALGLSTLQYSRASSIRNIMIIGFSLFMSLSIPAYIQQYEPLTVYVLPRYLVPFAAASSGPVRTGSGTLDYIVNALLSINVIVAFMVAFILDNTVPGTREERGMYIWSKVETAENESIRLEEYALPKRIGKLFRRAKCLGT